MREMLRLTQENNKMLHAMRRSAFWGGLIKFIIYSAILLGSIWFYMQFVFPVLNQALKAMQEVQGTGAKAQAQLGSFNDMLKQLQSKLGGSSSGSTQ